MPGLLNSGAAIGSLPLLLLGLGFAVCLAVSALGFRRVEYFVSLGYAFSIAVEALVFTALFRETLDLSTIAQSALLLAYGLRLGSFLLNRQSAPSFERERLASVERGARVRGGLRLIIWVSVAVLYVLMYSPALLSLLAQSRGFAMPSIPYGLVIMLVGLGIESLADWQKSRFKAANPQAFCSVGLFGMVRCPNYFGEMVFWCGVFISGSAAYHQLLDWLVAGAGLVAIILVMLGSARRLELKQDERYGADPAYLAYGHSVPVLVPLLPVYSLKKLRIYLG